MNVSSVTGSSSSLEDTPTSKVTSAEKEANKRIALAAERATLAEKESSAAIERLRNNSEQEYIALNSRQETALESTRSKGYEQIRDLQRAQQALLRKTRREGETDLNSLNDYYRNSLTHTRHDGEEKLRELLNEEVRNIGYQKKAGEIEDSELQAQHEIKIQGAREQSESQLKALGENNRRVIEEKRIAYEKANQTEEQNLEENFKKTVTRTAETLDQLKSRANQHILDIRQDTAEKLAAYESRQNDPFYKLVNPQAKLEETSDSFILSVTIPDFEQEQVSASLKGDTLLISGTRRNEEELPLESGGKRSTSTFQSFHESIPLSWPVDMRKMTRESEGDHLIFRIPKKNEFAHQEPQKVIPERIRVQTPHFPTNLPHSRNSKENEPSPISGSRKGSGTLS